MGRQWGMNLGKQIECLEFNWLDMYRIKVKVASHKTFKPLIVNDGKEELKLVVFPVVY